MVKDFEQSINEYKMVYSSIEKGKEGLLEPIRIPKQGLWRTLRIGCRANNWQSAS
jgi:hypothetical protein